MYTPQTQQIASESALNLLVSGDAVVSQNLVSNALGMAYFHFGAKPLFESILTYYWN